MSGNETILEVRNLKKYFFSGKKRRGREPRAVKALDGVSFSMEYGETLGVVGESGCGKSTLGRTILRLHEPTEGQVVYRGKNLAEYGREEMRQMRRELQIIFPLFLAESAYDGQGADLRPAGCICHGFKGGKGSQGD